MSLIKAAATVSSLTLLSRITGVVRDMLIARYFGSSAATDAFYVAFRLPNMLRRLFAEGAFQQAFVPMLSDVKATKTETEVRSFIDRFIAIFEKKNTPGEVAVMKALANGKNIATWRANGQVYSVPLSPRIKTDNLTDEQAAQRYVDNFDESREVEIARIIYN